MATLKEIELRIDEHSKRLIELREKEPTRLRKIEVIYSLVVFWEGQKEKLIKQTKYETSN